MREAVIATSVPLPFLVFVDGSSEFGRPRWKRLVCPLRQRTVSRELARWVIVHGAMDSTQVHKSPR